MKIIKEVLGISILFLVLQQCTVAQQDAEDETEALIEQLEDLLPADDVPEVDTGTLSEDAVAPESEEADGLVGQLDEGDAEEEDPRIEEETVQTDVMNVEEPIEEIGLPEVECLQALNEECIEDRECCQGYTCHHRKKKCKSNGRSFAPLQPEDGEVINVDNDIIE